jgi:DNA/RNA endonuclease G (NUC1)
MVNKQSIFFLLGIILTSCTVPDPAVGQEVKDLREQVEVVTPIFTVLYSETKEQPITLTYRSTNRPKNVDRGNMNFYTEKDYHTSDNADYYRNIYDKGHLAPAATFSDSMENLKQTFSYLNCALQDQYLNRGEWRLLEEQEREWDDESNLTIKIDLVWDEGYLILPTGGHVPTDMIKHIYFEKTGSWKCFEFENVKPTTGWEEHQVVHNHD